MLEEGDSFISSALKSMPGASLACTCHAHAHHLSEHWIALRGMAKVISGGHELFMSTNESTCIPAGHKHHLDTIGLLNPARIEVPGGLKIIMAGVCSEH